MVLFVIVPHEPPPPPELGLIVKLIVFVTDDPDGFVTVSTIE